MHIAVIRHDPPHLGRCRADTCRAHIEWARTPKGAAIPLDDPVIAEAVTVDLAGRTLTWVDTARVHWATCPESAAFHRAFHEPKLKGVR